MANKWLASRVAPVSTQVTTVILTSAMNLPVGTKIESRHVATMKMIPGQEPAGTYHDFKEVDGKVTTMNVAAGQMLMASMFAKEGENALAAIVSKDKRAVTVRVDDVVGVAGFLMPGNRVDVVATKRDDKSGIYSSETILSNIRVLAVDQTTAANSTDPVIVRAVTLEVTPAEGEALLKGKAAGTIQLALRNPSDQTDARRVAVVPKAIKTVAPEHNPNITVIRGTMVGHDAPHE